MDNLFSEIYSGESAAYGPLSFLATTWRASSELAGYAQQDAHEFFITALNQIHATSRGSTSVSCDCIIHNTFSGQLQSEVKCERCGIVTTTVDPMLDISLELEGQQSEAGADNTLDSCLRRYRIITLFVCGTVLRRSQVHPTRDSRLKGIQLQQMQTNATRTYLCLKQDHV